MTERQPSSLLLHTYYGAKDTAATRKTPATREDADEEQPAKRRKSELGRAKDSEGITKNTPKRRKSEVGPTKTSEGATKDAPPKPKNGGLPFNATWYNSPLEDPKVYCMKDKVYTLDTYNDLADIIARATEDHDRIYEGSIAQERILARVGRRGVGRGERVCCGLNVLGVF
ncbi:hypothetical protein N7449_005868 [Penicillium cf. viridicatum]|uniref:Uncharacterized protein n=1 Tax=Penicillium cf. viridicatum TaxID=2972119 RepID=A0A9W9SWM7_9EURO|nr:hypothetical protein N7449_005868 [Penicillium cf. viridicatum]